MIIDTHAHIDMLEDPELSLKEAQEAGVEEIIIPGADSRDFDKIIKFTQNYDKIYALVGVHPEYADEFNDEIAKKVLEFAENNPKVVGIGEIGLDYHYTKENKDKQKKMFITQLEIAKILNLPVVVHDRDAHFDTLEILKQEKIQKALLHCFSGSVEFAKECINLGYKIAIGGVVTFKNAITIKEVVREIELENIMLETDCPYLTPHPFRGMENSPKYIGFVAKEIAKIKNITYDSVCSETSKNAREFFNLK